MIINLIAIFIVIAGIDKVLGNKFKIGEEFSKAFYSMGALSLSMIGMISLAPVLADFFIPLVSPIYARMGADPSMFASTLLALDMGGYKLAVEMAIDQDAANFSWVFLGTMMGPTLVFTIPVALNLIDKKDYPYFSKGILIGLMTIPIGSMIGGMLYGFDIMWMAKNLLPTILLSIIIMVSLLKFPAATTKMFIWFSKVIESVLIIGLVIVAFQSLTGVILIQNLVPIEESFKTVGNITIILAGAFPFVYFLKWILKKPILKLSEKTGLNDHSLIGLLSSLAHHIPMFTRFNDLNIRGKVVNTAFAVSGAFVFGSHLGFVGSVDKNFIVPMIVGKLTAGTLAGIIAYFSVRE
jgi:ethanolamine transporter